mmetsp:Transcript_57267/g.102358  ORF Transcript_57267/g.102358 Transcript_57267/m.102358 type:complete len:82 (+) Transcript_57267:2029-2274(+)
MAGEKLAKIKKKERKRKQRTLHSSFFARMSSTPPGTCYLCTKIRFLYFIFDDFDGSLLRGVGYILGVGQVLEQETYLHGQV